jgi:hypothetical protein
MIYLWRGLKQKFDEAGFCFCIVGTKINLGMEDAL